MTYEAWRCTYQSGEQAARAAYEQAQELQRQNAALKLEAANAKELVTAVGAGGVERLRKWQCQGCDVPKDGVYLISEPMQTENPMADFAAITDDSERVRWLANWLDQNSSGIYRPSAEAAHLLLTQRARIAELEAQLAAAQQGVLPIAKELAEMLDRSITGLGHYRNTENWSEADEEHINECNALLERFACVEDADATNPTTQGLELHPNDVIKLAGEVGLNVHRSDGWPDEQLIAKLVKFAAQAKQGGV